MFPCEQSIFAFQKLERRENGTNAFPCEQNTQSFRSYVSNLFLRSRNCNEHGRERMHSLSTGPKLRENYTINLIYCISYVGDYFEFHEKSQYKVKS